MTDTAGDTGSGIGPEICVVGSINEDIVVGVAHHPGPGETILGGDWFSNPGGKGANQAVAAARLGRRVAMVGCVGDDDAGQTQRRALESDGIDTSMLAAVEAPTGRAFITVAANGENRIVVSPGANAALRPEVVRRANAVAEARVVLIQLEIPTDAVVEAIEAARGIVVLNPAPAPAATRPLSPATLAQVSVLVPNEVELAQLAGPSPVPGAPSGPTPDLGAIADQAQQLMATGVGAVVVTLGSNGALVVEADAVTPVPAMPAQVLDTTAAGDSFCGALGDALVRGEGLVEAAVWASRVGALTVSRPGAQQSLPTRQEVIANRSDR